MIKNIASNWVINAASILISFFLTPFIVKSLGTESYGIWNLILSFTGYLGLIIIGVPMASVRFFSEYIAKKDYDKLNEVIATCLVLYLILGVTAIIFGGIIFVLFKTSYHIPEVSKDDAYFSFVLVVINIAAGFVTQIPSALLASFERFVVKNVILLIIMVVRVSILIIFLQTDPKVSYLAIANSVCIAIEVCASIMYIRQKYSGVRINIKYFNKNLTRSIISYSFYILLLSIGGRLAYETDSIVIGAYLEVSDISYYAIGNSFMLYLTEFFIAISAVVMPVATKMIALKDRDALQNIFLKWSKIAFFMTLTMTSYLILFGPKFIGWWIDSSFEEPSGIVLQILMCSCIVLYPVRGVAFPIAMALKKPIIPTIAFLISGVINLILSILLVRDYGLVGIALGTAIPNVLFAICLLKYVCIELKMTVIKYLQYVVIKPLICGLSLFVVLYYLKVTHEVEGILELIIIGIFTVTLFSLSGLLWVFKEETTYLVKKMFSNFKNSMQLLIGKIK
jgi:O-antigen/teichoic acid export membrane protein